MGERDPKRGQPVPAEDRDALFRAWCKAIESGMTYRAAALKVGIPLGTLMYWSKAPHRADWLADAAEKDIQRHLDILEDLIHSEDDPKSIRAKASVSQWLLSKKDRARFGEHRQVDQSVTVTQGGQEDNPMNVARDALALMSPEERAELARLASGEGDV